MDDERFEYLRQLTYAPSRIPAQDALVAVVPSEGEPDPVITETAKNVGHARWYPIAGGFRVVILYQGGAFDRARFKIERGAWDHEHCELCSEHIPPRTLCWMSQGERCHIVCEKCHSLILAGHDQ